MAKVAQGAHRDRHYWLLKSEPGTFSFDDLWNSTGRKTHWDGVRNFQARNYMRDEMKKGDLAFFYHSGAEPGIVGIVEITASRSGRWWIYTPSSGSRGRSL